MPQDPPPRGQIGVTANIAAPATGVDAATVITTRQPYGSWNQ